MLLRIGETIDRYKIEALIGQGGMAAVYRVRHVQLDSEHALKVLFITAPQIYQRLIREGRVQANLRHPNIVSVTDVLSIHGSPALVMEYIDGPALDTWLLENRPTLEEGLWLFRGILRGIATAHERGVVHRDLKPANVLLAPSDEGFVPKVTDFGLVKSVVDQRGDTMTGMSLGTPEYMSPEQIRDASDIDTRSDMWGLGCILYELVCHKRAFQGTDKIATFNLICTGTYDPPRKLVPNLPRNVAEAIRSLLELDREQRLSSCEALYDLLYEEGEPKSGRIAAPQRPIMPLKVDPPSVDPAPLTYGSTNQLLVPTEPPAIPRMAAPTASITAPTQRPGPTLVPLSPVLAVLLLGTLLVLGGVAAGVAWFNNMDDEAPGPKLRQALQAMPHVTPPVVLPPIDAEAEDAVPTAVGFDPSQVGGSARIRVIGDARDVWLVAGGGRWNANERITAGSYEIVADFGGEAPVPAGKVDVVGGRTLTLACSSSLAECRSQ